MMKTNLLLTAALSLSFCAASTAQTLPAYLPSDGLVGWWPFNGNANDESGNGQHLNQNGLVEFTQDRWGNSNSSGYFTGNGYFYLDNAQLPLGNQDRTINFWVNQDSILVEHCAFSQYKVDACFNFFCLELNGPPAAATLFWAGCSACSWDNYNLINTWVNYTLVYENTYVTLYKNGVPLNTAGNPYYSLDNPLTTQENFAIAYRGKASDPDYFLGAIDDFGFWNRALSPAEVNALYTGATVNPPTTCNPLPANLQNGLVGYWPFCGNANDESGNGNDGTVNGATLTEDRFGDNSNAYVFNGITDNISIPNTTTASLSSSYSISFWMSTDDTSLQFDGHEVISDRDINSYDFKFRLIYGIEQQEFLQNTYLQTCSNSTSQCNQINLEMPTVSQWEHWAMVYNFDNQEFSGFRNGEFVGSVQNVPYSVGARQINIGRSINPANPNGSAYYKGNVDDIGIWNRALSADEVQQLYTLNACTFTIYDTVTVTETIYDTVSVSLSTTDTLIINTLITAVEPPQENTFLVYPNPASTQITINNGNVAILGGYTMRISNSLGQDVYNQSITQSEVTLDLSTWGGNGLYVLYIIDPQQNMVAVKQIVLQ